MNIRVLFRNNGYLILVVAIYLASVLITNPFSEYAVNDDWDFITHVRNFREGDFVKNSLIDSSFILQGYVGTTWSYIFGLNYPALKALTVLFTLITLIGLDKVLKLLDLGRKQRFIGLGVFLFNPFVYLSSVTFMTEIYFLCFVIWSVYFELKYLRDGRDINILWVFAMTSASLLVRQLGLLLFPAHLFFLLVTYRKNIRRRMPYILSGSVIFIICGLISFLWPQYNSDFEKPLDIVTKSLVNPGIMLNALGNLHYIVPYLALSSLVFTLPLFARMSRISRVAVLAGSAVLFNTFFLHNIFKLGNMFYPEGLFIKNNYITHITLYDNVLFKVLLNIILLVALLSFMLFVIENIRKLKQTRYILLSMVTFFLILPIALQDNIFDRYFINGLVIFNILCQILPVINSKTTHKYYAAQFVLLFVWAFYVFTLSYDFHKGTQIQWQQAGELKKIRDVENRIFLSDTYTKYSSVFFKPNGPQISMSMPTGIDYECYIQKDYFSNSNNLLYKYLKKFNHSDKIKAYFSNPGVFGSKTLPGYKPPSRDPNRIVFKESYFSFQNWIVGTEVKVITYCYDRRK